MDEAAQPYDADDEGDDGDDKENFHENLAVGIALLTLVVENGYAHNDTDCMTVD